MCRYAGYAGELSPAAVQELLLAESPALLVDIRPDAVRAKQGLLLLKLSARWVGSEEGCFI
jgi:hypothetical protein